MTDQRDQGWTGRPEDDLTQEGDTELGGDRTSGWDGVEDAPGGTGNRPAGPDYGDSPLDDETPGSQGEIEAGSEGDFGDSATLDPDRAS